MTGTVGSVDVTWLGHASVKLVDSDSFTVYIDPWSDVMPRENEPADVIVSTHDDFDHFDVKAIQSVKKRDTVLVCHPLSADSVPEDLDHKTLEPGRSVKVKGKRFRGVHAYNNDKMQESGEPFHARGDGFGVLFELDGVKFYHAADTDVIDEMESLAGEEIDVAFLPVGGTYTMDQEEAIEAVKTLKPDQVVPIHFGVVDGTNADVGKFERDVRDKTGADPLVLEREQ